MTTIVKIAKDKETHICQGEVLRGAEYVDHVSISQEGDIIISKICYPLVIVISQECDLTTDSINRYNPDKKKGNCLLSAMLAPLYNADHFFLGEHLADLKIEGDRINSDRKSLIKNNLFPRFHYLEFPRNSELIPCVVDFKHYFSLPMEYLYDLKKNHFVCKLSELFRESLTTRFANYFSRIGLPENQ